MKYEMCMLGLRVLAVRGSSLYQSMDTFDIMSTSASRTVVSASTLRRLEYETLTRYFFLLANLMKSDTSVQIALDGSSVGKFSEFMVFSLHLKNFAGESKTGSCTTQLVGLPQVSKSYY